MIKLQKITFLGLIFLLTLNSLMLATNNTSVDDNERVSDNSNINTELTSPNTMNSKLTSLINKETFYQESFGELRELSTKSSLIITKLNEPANIDQKPSIIFTNVQYFLLNFTYLKEYFTESVSLDQEGILQYDIKNNVTLTTFAYFPLIMEFYSNSTAETGNWNNIITRIIASDIYNSKIGFTIDFGMNYKFLADVFFAKPQVGPANFIHSFTQSWTFLTPLDGSYVGEKQVLEVPTSFIPLLQGLGIGVQPKIDADMSSLVSAIDPSILLSKNELQFKRSGDIQSFSFNLPEFYSQSTALIDLFNFDLDFTLSLEFFLRVRIGIPFINIPLDLHIFSWPVATANLPLVGSITHEPLVTPSEDIPYVYGVNYDVDDNNDRILNPGDDVNLTFMVTNLGEGSAIGVNVSAISNNVTVLGTGYADVLFRNRGNYEIFDQFYFNIPSSYTDFSIFIDIVFNFYSPNGSIYSTIYPLYFRVVQPGDSYIEISDIFGETSSGLSYWNSGDQLDLLFNVTNRGSNTINLANISFWDGIDTDLINPVTIISSGTNTSSSLTVGSSSIIGNISLSSPSNHDDGLVYLYFLIYYEDDTYTWSDLFYFAVPIYYPKPSFDLLSSTGIDFNSNGIFEAGESVDLQFELQNIGLSTAQEISAEVYSYSSDLNFTVSEITFNNLNSGNSGFSTLATVIISESARNQTATFSITIYAYDLLGNLVTQSFNISIGIFEAPLPLISLLSYTLDDSLFGNNDGIADPGEIILLYVNIEVTNSGLGIYGNISTKSALKIFNTTSRFGSLANSFNSGNGWIIEVPLNYDGSQAIINVTLVAESLSGRLVSESSLIILDIDNGDIMAPSIGINGSLKTVLNVNEQYLVPIVSMDPFSASQLYSDLLGVYFVYSFNSGEIQIEKIVSTTTKFDYKIDSSLSGTYEFILVAVDNAGNLAYSSNGTNPFLIEVIQFSDSSSAISSISDSSSELDSSATFESTDITSDGTIQTSSWSFVSFIFALSITVIISRRKKQLH